MGLIHGMYKHSSGGLVADFKSTAQVSVLTLRQLHFLFAPRKEFPAQLIPDKVIISL